MVGALHPSPSLPLLIEVGLPSSAIMLLYPVVPETVLKVLPRQDPRSNML